MNEPRIIFEDEDMLIIDKPAGMVVNKADTTKNMVTVQEWAEGKVLRVPPDRNASQSDAGGQVSQVSRGKLARDTFLLRGGIVHRLDKETSGILVIAKNEQAFANLQEQFKSRNVKKTYITLVHGELKPEVGEINVPIGRLPWNRTRFGVLADGREASSKYKVLGIKYLVLDKVREPLSLVEVYPQTGRTHQIRVHMRHVGHPIFADELYAGRKVSKRDRKLLPHHFLHASKIAFDHPRTGEKVEFESKLLPDLQEFLQGLP